jgi:hypothetical protein
MTREERCNYSEDKLASHGWVFAGVSGIAYAQYRRLDKDGLEEWAFIMYPSGVIKYN